MSFSAISSRGKLLTLQSGSQILRQVSFMTTQNPFSVGTHATDEDEEAPETHVSHREDKDNCWPRAPCLHSAQDSPFQASSAHSVRLPNCASQDSAGGGLPSAEEEGQRAVRPSCFPKVAVAPSVGHRAQDSSLGLFVQEAPFTRKPGAPGAIPL